jgi:AcrR family transcriptional regulator
VDLDPASSANPAEKRRQKQRQETRRAILDAAGSLLVEDGYESFSMRRLAASCGYTAPTIYHYFQDKAGLIDALLEERFAGLYQRLSRTPDTGDPADRLREILRAFIRFGFRNPTHYRLLTTPRGLPDRPAPPSAEKVGSFFETPFRELSEAGRLVPEDPQAALQTAWALSHGLISLRDGLPDYEWSRSVLDVAVDTVLRGLVRRPDDS